MNTTDLSQGEQDRLRLCRKLVWAIPIAAGCAYGAALAAVDRFGLYGYGWHGPAFFATDFAAGCAAAYMVARLHPVHRGKWLRAALAFVFGLAVTWITAGIFFILSVVGLSVFTARQ